MRNTWIDTIRRTKMQGEIVDIDEQPDFPFTDGNAIVDNALLLRSVSGLIDRLPVDQREVILLVCVEELSYQQAAEVLDVPIGTTMSRLARARTAIANALE